MSNFNQFFSTKLFRLIFILLDLFDQVSITPEVTSRGVNRAIIKELVSLYRQTHLGGRLPAYDGRKSLYTAGPLPFSSKNFQITLRDEEEGSSGQRFFLVLKSMVYNV